jgi:hypothetical protein
VWVENGEVIVADRGGKRALPVPDDLLLPPAPPAADPNSSNRLSHIELGPFTRLCEALRDAVEGKQVKAAVAVPTFRDGLATMVVLDAIRASAANGGALQTLNGVSNGVVVDY